MRSPLPTDVLRRLAVVTAVTLLISGGTVGAAATAPGTPAPASQDGTIHPEEWVVEPAVGSLFSGWHLGGGGTALGLWRSGSATGVVDLRAPATRLVLEAGADRCQPGVGARTSVLVDGEPVLTNVLVDADSGWYTAAGHWDAGRHHVEMRFLDDYRDEQCDRNLKVYRVIVDGGDPAQSSVQMRASSASRAPTDAGVLYTKGASAQPTQLLWSNAAVRYTATVQHLKDPVLTVQASGHHCEGPARMIMRVGDRYVGQQEVGPDERGNLRTYRRQVPFVVAAGSQDITVEFVNDHRTPDCDRNLKVGSVWLAGS